MGYKVPSGVSDMPLSLQELREGAKNRAQAIIALGIEADYYVGMEGGVFPDPIGPETWMAGVIYIESVHKVGHYGYTTHIRVPDKIRDRLYDGSNADLETIMHELAGIESVGEKNGSFGAWSDDMITRTDAFASATQAALAPFFNNFYK